MRNCFICVISLAFIIEYVLNNSVRYKNPKYPVIPKKQNSKSRGKKCLLSQRGSEAGNAEVLPRCSGNRKQAYVGHCATRNTGAPLTVTVSSTEMQRDASYVRDKERMRSFLLRLKEIRRMGGGRLFFRKGNLLQLTFKLGCFSN